MTKPDLAIVAARDPDLRLDLACGNACTAGFRGVDLHVPAEFKVDLSRFPWPWEDESVAELHCSHFCEHLPAREVSREDLIKPKDERAAALYVGQDMWLAFMDECYRILKPDGRMKVIVPNVRHVRAWQDPTHRRFFTAETFLYLNLAWRSQWGISYKIRSNWHVQADPVVPTELTLLHPEAMQRRLNESWNVIHDWHARLVKLPPQQK